MRQSPVCSLVIALGLAVSLACAQSDNQREAGKPMLAEMQPLWSLYQSGRQAAAAERDQRLKNLDYIYMLNVDKLQKDRAAVGDLDGALAAKAELERLGARQAATDGQRKVMNPELGKLRAAYDAALKGYHDEAARQNAALLQKLLADLEALQTRITTTGDLDKALKVKAEKERIAAEAAKPAATQGIAAIATQPVKPATVPVKPAVPAVSPAKPAITNVEDDSLWRDVVRNPAGIEVPNMQPQPLTQGEGKDAWTQVPQKLLDSKAVIFKPSGKETAIVNVTVTSDGWLLVAASYNYEGNESGGWVQDRWLAKDFKANGWHQFSAGELGGALAKGRVIFGKFLKKGDRQRLRCNKYHPPLPILPGGK